MNNNKKSYILLALRFLISFVVGSAISYIIMSILLHYNPVERYFSYIELLRSNPKLLFKIDEGSPDIGFGVSIFFIGFTILNWISTTIDYFLINYLWSDIKASRRVYVIVYIFGVLCVFITGLFLHTLFLHLMKSIIPLEKRNLVAL